MKILTSTENLTREQWLDFRRQGIGGSDVYKLVPGLSEYGSPVTVWHEKVNGYEKDLSDNEKVYWGNVLEPVLAAEFAKRHPEFHISEEKNMFQHPDYPFMLANVDRGLCPLDFADKKLGILEIKTGGQFTAADWIGKDEETGEVLELVPERYMLQVQHYLAVTGLDFAFICVLIGGQKYVERYIERNEEIISALIQLCTNFWLNHVVPRIPPQMDGSKAAKELVRALWSVETKGLEVQLGDDAELLRDEYKRACEDEKHAQKRKQECQNRLAEMMKEAEIGFLPCGKKVMFKTVNRAAYTVEASSYRQMRIG